MTVARSKEQMMEQGKITTSVQWVDDWCKEQGADDGARKNNDQCARGGRWCKEQGADEEQGKITTSVQGVDDWCKERGADDGARKNNNNQCARGGQPVRGARSR